MTSGFSRKVERASWFRVAIAFVLLAAYVAWGFGVDASWANAVAAAGGRLPETQPGFPEGEPARSYDLLRQAGLIDAYVRFQVIDIPFAIFNALFLASVLALALKKFASPASPLRFVLALPFIYLAAEFVEDPLLVLVATGKAPGLAYAQQIATTMKWASSTPTLLLVFVALIFLVVSALTGAMRRKKA